MQMNSQEGSVVITQEMPIVEAGDEKSSLNRLSKFARKITQKEWISELDLFSVPLKLNFNGEDVYKTEFGGLIYLMIGVCSIVLTIIFQFPDGIGLNSSISFYDLTVDGGPNQKVFDYTNSFFNASIVDGDTNQRLVGSNLSYYLRNISIWNVFANSSQRLELQIDLPTGAFYFNYSTLNSMATIYGFTAASYGKLHLQYTMCPLSTLEPECLDFYFSGFRYYFNFEINNYVETDGGLLSSRYLVTKYFQESSKTILFSRNEFTTNNFLGYMANILNYQLNYYTVGENQALVNPIKTGKVDPNCASPQEPDNYCFLVDFTANGKTNMVTSNFDDATVPLLFFLSLSQTIFFLVYLLFLKNYANNALRLRIADTLVYISQPDGKHYNFKSGVAVFIACLFHNHAFFELLDKVLYALFQTEYKKCLPLKAQLAIDMINYGEDCLDEGEFFGQINQIYSQENVQPVKIIVDLESEDNQEEEEVEEPAYYFEDQTKEEAFKRMCEEHEFYSPQKKLYLKNLLEETDKKYKLVVITQEIFERYRRKVEEENHTKEIELPIKFAEDEISGHNLKKQNFN